MGGGEHVHLAGFARGRDVSGGNIFAPCGAMIGNRFDVGIAAASADLARVTCPACRAQARALGRAYSAARRLKRIDW